MTATVTGRSTPVVPREYRRSYGRDVYRWLARLDLLPHRLRPALLRRGGVRFGDGPVLIYPGLLLQGGAPVTIGSNVFVNAGCHIEANAEVIVGDDVSIGPRTVLVTATHEPGERRHRAGTSIARPVMIGDGCWLGAGVTVLPGVRVAAGCVIAAGAVVTADTAADGLYGGVPARRLRDLS